MPRRRRTRSLQGVECRNAAGRCEITEELAEKAGLAAAEGAITYEANAYKVQLIKTLVKRELLELRTLI